MLLSHRPDQPSLGPSVPALAPPPVVNTDSESCFGRIPSPPWKIWNDEPPSVGPADAPPRPNAPPPAPADSGPQCVVVQAESSGTVCC